VKPDAFFEKKSDFRLHSKGEILSHVKTVLIAALCRVSEGMAMAFRGQFYVGQQHYRVDFAEHEF
jgi:hypothetical protein